MMQKLSITDHSRDIAGLKYVYPVISRRAGGLSIGINFNINNTCNWRCVYCQVPDLIRGAAPEIDLLVLEQELRYFLKEVLVGAFYEQFKVPESQRSIKDIAISGNGEPTSLKNFSEAVELIGKIAQEMKVFPESHFILITNGSLIHQANVQKGLKILNKLQGQVWFKLDSATEFGRQMINNARQTNKKVVENIIICSSLCATSLQTIDMQYLTLEAAAMERNAYLVMLSDLKKQQINLSRIMLYTLARPSLQPEAEKLKKQEKRVMDEFADTIRSLGFEVSVS